MDSLLNQQHVLSFESELLFNYLYPTKRTVQVMLIRKPDVSFSKATQLMEGSTTPASVRAAAVTGKHPVTSCN